MEVKATWNRKRKINRIDCSLDCCQEKWFKYISSFWKKNQIFRNKGKMRESKRIERKNDKVDEKSM